MSEPNERVLVSDTEPGIYRVRLISDSRAAGFEGEEHAAEVVVTLRYLEQIGALDAPLHHIGLLALAVMVPAPLVPLARVPA